MITFCFITLRYRKILDKVTYHVILPTEIDQLRLNYKSFFPFTVAMSPVK